MSPKKAAKQVLERTPKRKQAPIIPPPDALWISARQVRARYGNRSAMWLVRRLNEKMNGKLNPAFEPNFPRPTYFGRLMFFRIADLEQYERTRAGGSPPAHVRADAAEA